MFVDAELVFLQKTTTTPLNHAKLPAGGAASVLQVRVTDPPSVTSPAGKSVMEVKWGASAGEQKKHDWWSQDIQHAEKFSFFHPFVPTPKRQGDGRGPDLLWWDGPAGVGASVLAVEAIDDHPLLVGAKIQSIPVCRTSADCLGVFLTGNLNVTHLYSARFLPGAAHPRA